MNGLLSIAQHRNHSAAEWDSIFRARGERDKADYTVFHFLPYFSLDLSVTSKLRL